MTKTKVVEEVDLLDMLPDDINILHRRFRLVERDYQQFATDSRFGEINFIKNEIQFLDREGSDTADTIIHEVLHGIWNIFDLDAADGDIEEHVVRALATGLVTVMKDNPTLFPVLQRIVDE